MKGSTAGARHLAASGNWLAWNQFLAPEIGTLMESAAAHWSIERFAAFWKWSRELPEGTYE